MVVSAARTMPMMSDSRFVLVRNADAHSAKDQETLASYVDETDLRAATVSFYVSDGDSTQLVGNEVDVFQLDIGEVRRFCADAELADLSLESILGWFRERCTVVVTLERFGAIGQLVGHAEPIAAWPLLIDEVADSTGAGDALGAGIAASMLVGPFGDESDAAEERLEEFAAALAFGRACGAYACTTIGGASDCPDLEQLSAARPPSPPFERKERPRHVQCNCRPQTRGPFRKDQHRSRCDL